MQRREGVNEWTSYVAWEIGVDNRGSEEGRNNAAQTTAKRHAARMRKKGEGVEGVALHARLWCVHIERSP